MVSKLIVTREVQLHHQMSATSFCVDSMSREPLGSLVVDKPFLQRAGNRGFQYSRNPAFNIERVHLKNHCLALNIFVVAL